MNTAQKDLKAGAAALKDRVTPDTVDVFMYSAATWITHRTHFEKEFALAEGHKGVLIHGPLQGAYMIERLHDWATKRGGSLKSLRFRHLAPAIAGTELEISATVTHVAESADGANVTLDVKMDKVGEGPCTAGQAVVEVPSSKA